MTEYILSLRPAGTRRYGGHDPSAAIFKDGELVFAAEEERFTREKHASHTFPENAIRNGLEWCNIELRDIDRIYLGHRVELERNRLRANLRKRLKNPNSSLPEKIQDVERFVEMVVDYLLLHHLKPFVEVRRQLQKIGEVIPPIEARVHHACHAASAFHVSPYERALILTIDGRGEYDSTVVWKGSPDGFRRIRTYEFPNSLGVFYGGITEYLGYNRSNGEGKVMGLAPYGKGRAEIETALRDKITASVDYDVTALTRASYEGVVNELEQLFGRERRQPDEEITQWYKDLAYVSQKLLEEIVCDITNYYLDEVKSQYVCLAGGVALNCKMNKAVREVNGVQGTFIQPAANDAGIAIGAGVIDRSPTDVDPMTTVSYGTAYSNQEIQSVLNANKISYISPSDVPAYTADRIADGDIAGWFQGRMEFGPRALGNRSILADPRTDESRDRVNEQVKHRERWRPFAPSMLESRSDQYLSDAEFAPFMIKTFDTVSDQRDEVSAVLHPGDNTTRPQTVSEEENPRYWQLLKEFEIITGVPVLLNTSFNDHGEPIVESPKQALQAFFTMGLDFLVMGDFVVEKP